MNTGTSVAITGALVATSVVLVGNNALVNQPNESPIHIASLIIITLALIGGALLLWYGLSRK